jgi:hypothetical protein
MRRQTSPGLGDPKKKKSSASRPVTRPPKARVTPAVRVSGTQAAWKPRATMPAIPPEEDEEWPEAKTRPMPQCLDEAGPAMVAMGLGKDMEVTPRCTATPADLRTATIDPRDAFVLSLVDGATPLREIIDVSGMREDVLVASLDRLASLGFVALD